MFVLCSIKLYLRAQMSGIFKHKNYLLKIAAE